MSIDESQVSEMHGVWAGKGTSIGWVRLAQIAGAVEISVRGYEVAMNPAAARRLAQQLYRLARRIEAHTA